MRALWVAVDEPTGQPLPLDYGEILATGVERVRSTLEYATLATAFLGDTVTIAELRRVYEIVWGRPLDPGHFHRKILR